MTIMHSFFYVRLFKLKLKYPASMLIGKICHTRITMSIYGFLKWRAGNKIPKKVFFFFSKDGYFDCTLLQINNKTQKSTTGHSLFFMKMIKERLLRKRKWSYGLRCKPLSFRDLLLWDNIKTDRSKISL